MLQFLQTGKALYVLAAICGLGILTRWLTRNLYKRLIKETDNMTLTKNRNLRLFRQKTENTYQMNQGIPKVKPFLERQMYDFKFLKVSFNGWNSFSNQMTLLCFLAGGAAAFGAYWYRTDSYYIVLYGSVGILAGLFTILVDHGAGIAEKKQQLFTALDNYLENTLIYRLDQEREEGKVISGPHVETRENIRSIYGTSQEAETEMEEEPENRTESLRGRQKTRAERQKRQLRAETQARRRGRDDHTVREGADRNSTAEESSVYDVGAREVSARNTLVSGETARDASVRGVGAGDTASGGAGSRDMGPRDAGAGMHGSETECVDYLKRSLEQIAASRDRSRTVKSKEDWLKDLSPDELNLIGEILKEYLT